MACYNVPVSCRAGRLAHLHTSPPPKAVLRVRARLIERLAD